MTSRKPALAARMMRAAWRRMPAKRYDVGWEPGLVVPAADGSPLITDHYFPCAEGDFPTLLVRSPYGRGLPWSPMYGVLFAEQGFHVVLQSCRGTGGLGSSGGPGGPGGSGGSGGRFEPWRNEAADARAAVVWLREQSWFNGSLATIGPSYLGYVQWALALDPPPELKAMVVQVGLHDPHAFFHAGGVLHLENALASATGMTYQSRGTASFVKAMFRLKRRLGEIAGAQPLRGSYVSAIGAEMAWLDEVLTHSDPDDPYWNGLDLGGVAERLRVPTSLITGWHDALADQTLEQYGRLRRAGCETALLVGPWTHTSALQQGWPEVFAESLAWLRAHLCADPSGLRPTRVRVHVGGEDAWRDLDDWPLFPATATATAMTATAAATAWFPTSDGHLVPQLPAGFGPQSTNGLDSRSSTGSAPLASFRYDPADPTPSVGGPLLSPAAGPRDNSALEARNDVLTFTGPPLAEPLDLLGPVSARLTLSTDTGCTDIVTRLCDVDPQGRSVNVCEGPARLRAAGQAPARLTVPMSATAHRFRAGHRIRWQVSAGAHPRYARNPGTGEPPLDATHFTAVRVTVHSGSALLLPSGGV
ncbi:hydrolase [Streptomyces sp. NBRC 110611]|uniref:CocE/NonD family hydrolase n=1 Tax=Streptomyces sp. NBRC 110611 TaxID=1621259 RepID=UPI000855428D|nr:CocE/NonD family hydrolase [Streptomyces sp. NBRC 110611]GAU66520.1 hydrolase [Streptomyces sp. NBRC 110611]